MTDRLSSGRQTGRRPRRRPAPQRHVLIGGQPGSGKTILAQHHVFHNASVEPPAIYLTTVSEPLEKILRYGQSLDFFDPSARHPRDL
jgi:circadian clock protein KaiC